MDGTYSAYRGEEGCIESFGGETRVKETFLRLWHRWKDNIKVDLQEVGWGELLR
jgi:hypothetical protein